MSLQHCLLKGITVFSNILCSFINDGSQVRRWELSHVITIVIRGVTIRIPLSGGERVSICVQLLLGVS